MNGLRLRLARKRDALRGQRGINIVDLMIWVIIAMLLAANVFQGTAPYRQAAYIYQMRNDLRAVISLAVTNGAEAGFVSETEVATAVQNSSKSPGVTFTWGKFVVTPDAALSTPPYPSAMGPSESGFELASSVTPMSVPAEFTSTSNPQSTYVVIAHHAEVPDLNVVYFFDDVFLYSRGTALISNADLPPIQTLFGIIPATSSQASPSPAPTTPAPVATPTPSATPTTSATQVPVPSPTASSTPSATVAPSPSATASSTPAPTNVSSPSAAATAPATSAPTQAPSTAPSSAPAPAPTATQQSDPAPVTPQRNYDPKTKDFLFCHDGMMHSNSYNGMVQGHQNHPDDIMPPIPPLNYPGHNWNSHTAKVYYNNCAPVA